MRLFQRSMLHGKVYSGRVRGGVGVWCGTSDTWFPLFEARDSGLKVCAGGVRPKITLGITGLHEIMGRDYKIEEPHWGTSVPPRQRLLIFRYPAVTTKKHTLFKTLNNEIVYPVKTQDSENHTLFSGIYLFREFPPPPPGMFTSVSRARSCSAIDSKRLSVWIITVIL